MSTVNVIRLISNKEKTFPVNSCPLSSESTNLLLKIGTNTLERAPSANILRNKFGNLNATFMASETLPTPKISAISNSRTKPQILDMKVKSAIVAPERTIDKLCMV